MGLRTTLHVLGDDHQVGWGRISGPAEMPKSPPQEPVICPRCGSTKTKFCYYNNYNKSQPRHFCKSCKRHWTKGGTIRNVPAGGRRNKRRKIPTAAATAEPPQQHSSTNNKAGLNISASQGSNTDQFSFSNIGNTLDVNSAMVNPTSYQSLNDRIIDYYYYYPGNLDYSMGESTVTNLDIPTSAEMDLSNYWNWNEIDVLANSSAAADVDIAWDDIKP